MKAIYKFNMGYPYSNQIGMFIAEKEYIDYLIDNECEVYFGELDGKHSEVMEIMQDWMFTEVTDDPFVIKMFDENNLTIGLNPLLQDYDILVDAEHNEWYSSSWLEHIKKELNDRPA